MRFAVLSNVQGNLGALRAVLDAIDAYPGVSQIISAGDQVGLGPHPNEVIDLLRERNVSSLRGNYDDAVAFERVSSGVDFADAISEQIDRTAVAWTKRALTPENMEYLRDLPGDLRLFEHGRGIQVKKDQPDETVAEYRKNFFLRSVFGSLAASRPMIRARRVLVLHGSPRALNEFIRDDTAGSILGSIARVASADVLVSGHSGRAFVREMHDMTFVGPGSVSGAQVAPGEAEFAVVDAGKEVQVELQRVSYDPSAHLQAILARGLPPALAARFNLSEL